MTRVPFLLSVIVALLVLVRGAIWYRGMAFIPDGPSATVAEAARSLWVSETLEAPLFSSVRQTLAQKSIEDGLTYWQDVFALGAHGELFPKHSLFSVVVGALWYGIFGEFGFWLFQAVSLAILTYALNSTAYHLSGRPNTWATLLIVSVGTPLLVSSSFFSYDIHACMLITLGLSLARTRPGLGSFAMTLAVFVRPSSLLLSTPLLLAWENSPYDQRRITSLFLGAAIAMSAFLLSNWVLWGSPILTAYSRIPVVHGSELLLAPHPVGFDLSVLTADWDSKLFHSSYGALAFNLSFVALPYLIYSSFQVGSIRTIRIILGVATFYILYCFSYPHWASSQNGNRLLLPAVCLYCIPLIIRLGDYEESILSMWRRSGFKH